MTHDLMATLVRANAGALTDLDDAVRAIEGAWGGLRAGGPQRGAGRQSSGARAERGREKLRRLHCGDAALEGYIGARLLVEGLRKAAAKGGPGRLDDALAVIDDLSLQGFHVAFGKGRKTGPGWVEIGLRSRAGVLVN